MRGTALMLLVAISLGFEACGGGGGGAAAPTGGGGSLNVRALWEQSAAAQRFAPAAAGGFGTTIPAAVHSVVIKFQSAAESAPRCVAVDPATTPIDPGSGQRLVVLRGLPSGPGVVSIFGFHTDPDAAAEVCEGVRVGTPSFRSDPHDVEIVAGTRSDAGDIEVFAVPFVLENTFNPPPNGSVDNPVILNFTLAVAQIEGIGGLDPASITITVDQDNLPQVTLQRTLTTFGSVEATGFIVQSTPQVLAQGEATVHVHADILGGGRAGLDFSYQVTVQNVAAGVIQGTVVNCLTGTALAGATVQGVDPRLDPVAAGSDGRFRLTGVPFGGFALMAMAGGFIDSRITGTLTPATPEQELTIALCPTGGTALRIVLTWGSEAPAPADLDAHLRGPASGVTVNDEAVEFHLDFANPIITFPVGGGATLDIDSRNFSGPETQTIDQLAAGVYHFCVHDFTDRSRPGTQGLANSQARVRIFLGDTQRGEFLVPQGAGNVWDVFQIDTTGQAPVITATNTFTDEADRERVCRRATDADGDGLTDAQEAELGSDPQNPDTNANGVSDGQDVINGDSPLLPET